MEFSFEKLVIWQNARCLVKEVYEVVANFPPHERYGLTDQLRRAVVSIASNIAEGSGRYSVKEKVHFTEIAYGSLMEVICQLTLAVDLGLTNDSELISIRNIAEGLGRQLSAYRRSMLAKIS